MHNWYQAPDNQFSKIQSGSGYAGFQNINGAHAVIFSLWGTKEGNPTCEYAYPNAFCNHFTGEGEGTSILTPYDFKIGEWYSMKIIRRTEKGKTIYEQFVCKEGYAYELIASISFPKENLGIPYDECFLEDFTSNGLLRGCSYKDFVGVTKAGRRISAENIYFSHANNKYFEQYNQSLKCAYHVSNTNVISVISAGYNLTQKQTFPAWIKLTKQ